MYQLYIRYSDGTLFEIPYVSVSFTEELNKGKDARISFDYESLKAIADTYSTTVEFLLAGGYREIYVEKESTKIYYGVITDYNIAKNDNGILAVDIASVDFFVLLSKRYTDNERIFTSTEASEIAWTLIDESQTSDSPYSDLGITQGATVTSKNRDRTFRFDNVRDEIIKMTNANLDNGFDCDIDNGKAFNCYYPEKGSQRPNIFLDDETIINWRFRKPFLLSLTNKVYVLGEGFDDSILYVTRESGHTYKSAFGLLEGVLSERQIKTTSTLNDKGDRHLNNNQSPRSELVITIKDDDPDILNYNVGDSLRIKISELAFNSVYRRIIKRSMSIDSNGLGIVTLTLI